MANNTRVVTDQHLTEFKGAVRDLLQREVGTEIPRGLCRSLFELTRATGSSYGVMEAVLTGAEYHGGLSEEGFLSPERYQFLIFLDCLRIADLRDFVESHYGK